MATDSGRPVGAIGSYMRDLRRLGAGSGRHAKGSSAHDERDEPLPPHELVRPHLPYVVHVAVKLSGRGVPVEDLINEGNIGLLEAAERYDPSRNTRFLTYASWYVRKRMLRSLMRDARNVRLTEYQLKRLRDAARLRAAQRAGGEESPPHAGDSDRRSLVPIEQAAQLLQPELSLDASGPDDAGPPQLADADRPSPEQVWMEEQRKQHLRRAFRSHLQPQERRILEARFGLRDGSPRKLREIGADLGLSRERVRQLEMRALDKLRRYFSAVESAPLSPPPLDPAANAC